MQRLSLGELLSAALRMQASGEGAVIVAVAANRSPDAVYPSARLLLGESGTIRGHIHPVLDPLLGADARASLAAGRSGLRSYLLEDGIARAVGVQGGNVDVYFEVLSRPRRLIVVGAGHIAAPLVQMAKLLDFEVVVLDDRAEYATRERFPGADEIVVGPYRESLASIPITGDTYIVLVTRGHVHDQACLEEVLESPAAYIGMIGSKRRVRTVMAHARERGYDAQHLERVFAPIGLDIHAETPAEIALAIMAEIVNVRRGGAAPSLALGQRLHV